MHWKMLIINFSSCFLTGSDLTCKKVLFLNSFVSDFKKKFLC